MSFIASATSSLLVRPKEEIIVMLQTIAYTIIGRGGSNSAIIGLRIVAKRENRLQIPKTLLDTIDGK
jgi:hypothetical protein